MPSRSPARRIALAAALLAHAAAARAQTPGVPPLEPERRVYRSGAARLSAEDESLVASTVASIESAHPGRRFFVLVAPPDGLAGVARAATAEWSRGSSKEPGSSWRPD